MFVLGLSVWGRKHNPTMVCFVLAGSVLRGNIILMVCFILVGSVIGGNIILQWIVLHWVGVFWEGT